MKIVSDLVFWSAVYGSLLVILTILLAANVSRLRMKHKAAWGDKGKHDLLGAIRAHGNAAEFVPVFMILFLLWELQGASDNALAVMGGVFLVARLVHAYGMIAVHGLARQIGAAVSYLLPVVLAVSVLASAL